MLDLHSLKTPVFCCLILLSSASLSAQKPKRGIFSKPRTTTETDTSKSAGISGIKSYSSVIKKDAVSSEGIFKVHRVKADYYFEIPLNLLKRQFLVVNKLSKVPEKLNDTGLNKGINYENWIISFERDTVLNRIFIRKENPITEVPVQDAIARSVADNYISTVVDYFKIEAYNSRKDAVVIQVNKVFDGSSTSLNKVFDALGLGSTAIKDLSKIEIIKSFPRNIVVKSLLSSRVTNVELTVETTTNLVLLDEKPMAPRFSDRRIGIFTTPRLYFNDAQHKLEERDLITRWRLEPKDEDIERYMKGELVEPKKQIVYYIDSSTPVKWRQAIKDGIHDWQKAFEAAGFKNAIVARDAPLNDPSFDPDDMRYSVVTYAASSKANAMGPSVVDPRSGEILEADIIWWHNVMSMLNSWMRIQTGAIDPRVRKNKFSDEVMAHAIRFVSSHEVGHTLGLMHNMGSSYAFPVDSLRSASFTSKMGGTAPSIMDYARFNYVAQPGDGVKQITPAIGVYDKYAINWAYRYLGKENPHQELPILNQWIRKHEDDPMYRFGEQQNSRDAIDPSAQSEDLGNDAVKASKYGLLNLKRIVSNIIEWTYEDGKPYEEAGLLLNDAIGQWYQYAYHVLTNVGGIYIQPTVYGQNADSYTHVSKERQRESVRYLIDEVFNTPEWLFSNNVYRKTYPLKGSPVGNIEYSPLLYSKSLQSYIYYDLLKDERLSRMLENEAANKTAAYTVSELMTDLNKAILAKTVKGSSLDVYERNMQKGYIDALIVSIDKSVQRSSSKSLSENLSISCNKFSCSQQTRTENSVYDWQSRRLLFDQVKRVSDAVSVKRGELRRIMSLYKSKRSGVNQVTQDHYDDMIMRIQQALSTN